MIFNSIKINHFQNCKSGNKAIFEVFKNQLGKLDDFGKNVEERLFQNFEYFGAYAYHNILFWTIKRNFEKFGLKRYAFWLNLNALKFLNYIGLKCMVSINYGSTAKA